MRTNEPVRVVSLLMLASIALTAQVARQADVPLKNWSTPLYWQPNQVERAAAAQASPQRAVPQLQFSANQVSTGALTFIAITPCRLVDTRGAAAGFNGISPFSGPSIAAKTTVTFPVQSPAEASADTTPAPCGFIPFSAQAYSFNVTVVPHSGGAVDYISLWPAGGTQPFVATLNDPQGAIAGNAAIVPAGPSGSPGYGGISVYNAGPAVMDVVIDMNGFYSAPTDQSDNTASGAYALENNSDGGYNTASGAYALENNSNGNENTATGYETLWNNTTGSSNTATGDGALLSNTTGTYNTAAGAGALADNTIGNNNTAIGYEAALNDATGNNNIAIGYQAAYNVSSGNSNNIHIGNLGLASDNTVIWIGTEGTQTITKIAGIYGEAIDTPNLLVCIDGTGRLGTGNCSSTPSSRRFKEQIADMGDASSKLLQLRPVTFLYKPQYDDGSHALQYGLIAEEVAKLYPEMVGYDKDGQPSSVKYQSLTPMLLNEVQKQVQLQQQENRKLEQQNRKLEEQNRKLEDRLAALEALLSSQTSAAAQPAGIQ